MANKKKIKKTNFFVWNLYATVSRLYMKLKHHTKFDKKVFKQRNKKEGCVLLYNHACMEDHFLTAGLMGNTRVTFVITKRFYYNPTLNKVLKAVNAIPREQFKTDLASIMKIKKTVDAGGIVVISPAGQVTIDGTMPYIHPAIVKLLKMCKVDVYTQQNYGTYLSKPKWAKYGRKNHIKVKVVKTLTKEELNNLSNDEIYNKITNDLNINDLEYQKQTMHILRKDHLADGIDEILYICPKCGSMHTLKVENDIITCTKCGNQVKYNQYGFLEKVGNDSIAPANEHEWLDYQRNLLKNKLADGSLSLKVEVDFYNDLIDPNSLLKDGSGVIVFENNQLYYEGTKNNEPYHKDFDLDVIYSLPFDPSKRFSIPCEEGWYEFYPTDYHYVMVFVQAMEAYRELKEERNATN